MLILKRFNHNAINHIMLDNQLKSCISYFNVKKMIRFVPYRFFCSQKRQIMKNALPVVKKGINCIKYTC